MGRRESYDFDKKTIRQGVLEVLRDKLHCPAELLTEENWDEPLDGGERLD